MYLKKTPNTHGRIRLSIVDNYYDKVKKCSRQKTVESIGWLDELEKQYGDPIAYFTKRVTQLNEEKQKKQAPINFTFYDSDRLCIGDNLRKNFGYAALSQIYHELGIHTFLSQYHQLCWWFVFALPGRIAFPPEGGLTNHSFSYWWPLKSGSFLLF